MATLEDTFRMMKGGAPTNNEKEEAEIPALTNHMLGVNIDGKPEGSTTRDFMDCVKNTLVEARSGEKTEIGESSSGRSDQIRQRKLVENGKTLVALIDAIKENRLDSRVLANMEKDISQLTEHLSAYPEFRDIIRKRIK